MAKDFFIIPNADGTISGVCAGIAYYFGWKTWAVRLATVVLCLTFDVPIIVYILLWIFAPERDVPDDYVEICE